jgi:nitrite reductase/ring-hydroxylating ferredoxin subunit
MMTDFDRDVTRPVQLTRAVGIDRRAFMTRGTLAAVAAVLAGGCMAAATSPHVSLVVQLANFPALGAVGGLARVDNGVGSPVAAVRTGSSTFAAFSLVCPHFGCTVGVAGTHFQCPCHGAQFAATGRWMGGQPTGNLTSLTVQYDATAGTLTITG